MFEYVTPEQAGISSKAVLKFVKTLEKYKMATHSFIMARGNRIFAEGYYAPFHENFLHRIYSATKSFVAVAIGLCEEDGLLSLDDKLLKYLPEFRNENTNELLEDVSIRDMLMMSTAYTDMVSWFDNSKYDRRASYFMNKPDRVPGTIFSYDSQGSYLLGTIVEKLTGMPFLDYLRERALKHTGFSKEAFCLKAPGGYSWGDSGMLCTTRDLLHFARFVMDDGVVDGVRYMNKEFLRAATGKRISNDHGGAVSFQNSGYGYQVWQSINGAFYFWGMGGQYALCDREKDFIFVVNADDQGAEHAARMIMFHELHESIIDCLGEPLPEDKQAQDELKNHLEHMELYYADGPTTSSFAEKINGQTFDLAENPMGIAYIHFDLKEDCGILTYKNAQGVKELPFGLGHNVFCKFPEEGYSDMIGSVPEPGHKYDCASSADWTMEHTLRIRVQIIDKYMGNLNIELSFKDDKVGIYMQKIAEDFLKEYNGYAYGVRRR